MLYGQFTRKKAEVTRGEWIFRARVFWNRKQSFDWPNKVDDEWVNWRLKNVTTNSLGILRILVFIRELQTFLLPFIIKFRNWRFHKVSSSDWCDESRKSTLRSQSFNARSCNVIDANSKNQVIAYFSRNTQLQFFMDRKSFIWKV